MVGVAARADQKVSNIPPSASYAVISQILSQTIEEQIGEKQLPALSIALVDGSETVWAQGFGLARVEQSVPATAATIYRVGSVSKLFTDIAVMQLVERGQLSLDAPITDYLPDFRPANPFGKTLTLRQIMSHRSGLVREPPVGHYFDPDNPSLQQTVASLNQTTLVYAPETRTKYSNAGIAVVGHTLERIRKKPFVDHMNEAVLKPLGMESSSFRLEDRLRPELAEAVMWTYDGRTFPAPVFELGMAPAGNLYSNVMDLAKFIQSLLAGGQASDGRLLEASTLSEMMTPQFDKQSGTFGIGFHVQTLDGRRLVGHGGAVYGFSTQVEVLLDDGLGVALASSRDSTNGLVRRLAHFALRCMLAQKTGAPLPTFERTDPVSPERVQQLAGLFRAASGDPLRILNRNGRLFVRQGVYRREIRSDSGRLVVDDAMGFGMELTVQSPDQVVWAGQEYQRVEDVRPAPLPQRWQGLVGEYGWDHNVLYVYEEFGRLNCLIEWFDHYPLMKLGESEFSFPDHGMYPDEKLIFEREANGLARAVSIGGVRFERRGGAVAEGNQFRIRPVAPIEQLRVAALAAQPPAQAKGHRKPDLVDLSRLDDAIRFDIRYATENNFLGTPVYSQARALMQRPAAEALLRAQRLLEAKGYGLLIFDAYRPWHVTKIFWDATPDSMKLFVADPGTGSRHNRGCAVDLSLYDRATGKFVWMGAGYDEFSPRSFPDYPVTSSLARWHRELLRQSMEQAGFRIFDFEWWHFDYQDWEQYPILNTPLEAVP
jgi:CubicO group peptidase (beta-lactamase class C family)/D-alanyl-D-alanine dipeptidase